MSGPANISTVENCNALVFESSSIGTFAAAGTTTMHMLCESRAAPAARASYQ